MEKMKKWSGTLLLYSLRDVCFHAGMSKEDSKKYIEYMLDYMEKHATSEQMALYLTPIR